MRIGRLGHRGNVSGFELGDGGLPVFGKGHAQAQGGNYEMLVQLVLRLAVVQVQHVRVVGGAFGRARGSRVRLDGQFEIAVDASHFLARTLPRYRQRHGYDGYTIF